MSDKPLKVIVSFHQDGAFESSRELETEVCTNDGYIEFRVFQVRNGLMHELRCHIVHMSGDNKEDSNG